MKFEPALESAKLLRRYKRFLADIELDNGEIRTIHCANTGAMTGCATPGDTLWYSTSDNPKRKYPNSWEITQTQQGHFIVVNTAKANTLVVEAINHQRVKELEGYQQLHTEVTYGQEKSRIDILLSDDHRPDCYIEVKSVTLLLDQQDKLGAFPDAVTTRGQKHLRELIAMKQAGYRAVLFFAVLHTGIEKVTVAHHIDRDYSLLLKQAEEAGVEVLCYQAQINPSEISLTTPICWQNHHKY